MLQVTALNKNYGPQIIFDDASFNIGTGEKVGLVGRNGSGKSTLFKLILNLESCESGEITASKGYKIGYLNQHLKFVTDSILKEVTIDLPEEMHYKAKKILMGLGFSTQDFLRSPLEFSGGFQIRLQLAKLLLSDAQMLLLDEPTNYLDIKGLRWLKEFLKSFQGEIILITHDRSYMDEITTHTMGIVRHQIKKLKGNTLNFYQKQEEEELLYEQTRLNQEKKREELTRFIERFKAKASKAKQAQSRMKQLEKMGQLNKMVMEKRLGFEFTYHECLGKVMMKIQNLSFGYTPSNLLIDNFSLTIENGERIAIIGANGQGKSTLLNLLAGYLHPISGEITTHPGLKIGHFGQTNIERLHPENTIIDEIASIDPLMPTTLIRNICGSVMFEGDMAKKKIKILSGGEKSRVMLGKVIAKPSNILLLDEPTNHLDMESVDAITQELSAYEGTVVLVTHSEMLIKTLAEKLIIFHGNRIEIFNGSYDDFLDKGGFDGDEQQETKKQASLYHEDKLKRSELIKERSRVLKPLKKQIEDLELSIIESENRLNIAQEELIQASNTGNAKEITTLSTEVKKLEKNIEECFKNLEIPTQEYDNLIKHYKTLLGEDS